MRRTPLILFVLAGGCYFFSSTLSAGLFGLGVLLELLAWLNLVIKPENKTKNDHEN